MITDISLDVALHQSTYPPDVDRWCWFWHPLRWIVWLWNHNVVKYNQDFVPLVRAHTHTHACWCNACLRATGQRVFFSCNLWRPHRGSFIDANHGGCWWPEALEGQKVQSVKRFLTGVEYSHKPNQETIWGFNRLSGRSRGALRCLSAWLNPDGIVTAIVWFGLAWLYRNPQAALRRQTPRPPDCRPATDERLSTPSMMVHWICHKGFLRRSQSANLEENESDRWWF